MKKHLLQIAKIVARTFLLFLLTAGIGFACRSLFIFNYNLLEEKILSPEALHVFFLIFFVLIINSITLSFYRTNQRVRKEFSERGVKKEFLPNAKFIVCSLDFYVEIVCITVLLICLPSTVLFGFEYENADDRLRTLLIILPIIYALNFVERIEMQKYWYAENKKNAKKNTKPKKRSAIKAIAIATLLYSAAAICLPLFIPISVMLWEMGGIKLLLWLLLALIAIVLITVLRFVLRALSKRRRFLRNLKAYCKDHALKISHIKRPYLSIFITQKGADFTIEKNGQKYDCKLIAGLFPGSPMTFGDQGNGFRNDTVRIFRTELFRFITRFQFGFDSDNQKIVIVVPIPRTFYVSTNQFPLHQADTGEKAGEYTIYNATGFLGALDRNCL